MEGLEFDWDEGNMNHFLIDNKERGVLIEDVESVFYDTKQIIQFDSEKENERRIRIIGKTRNGILITIIFVKRLHKIRPVTGWRLSSKNKNYKLYEKDR